MTTTAQLAEALARLGEGLSAADQRTALAVYGLLAGGRPVTPGRLAARVDRDRRRVADLLTTLPGVERDAEGRVVGFGGLTLRPTPYRLELGRQVLHARCALDGLITAVALDAAAELSANCPVSGQTVRLGVTPEAVVRRAPDTGVLSFRDPTGLDAGQERGLLCAVTRLFAGREAAQRWTARVPPAFILTVDDALRIARGVVRHRYGDARMIAQP